VRCEDVRELAPDLALGIADGEERAAALAHLSRCGECRRLLEQLSQVADELLIVAPVEEPPPGFESRVMGALGLRPEPRRRLAGWFTPRRLATTVGPALAAAAVTAAVLMSVYHDDRVTADRYRETLQQADGRYFQAQPLRGASGARAGVAFGYEGSPSWLFLTVYPEHRDDVRGGELLTRGGETIPLRGLRLDPAQGSWGGAIPVPLHEVDAVRLLGERPGELLSASFPEVAGDGG
jgi:Putative zinc-finger